MGLTDERSIDGHSVCVYIHIRNLSQVPTHPKKITYPGREGSNRLIIALKSFRRKFSGRKDFVHFIHRLSNARNIKFFV
jgi:hypothetical protein